MLYYSLLNVTLPMALCCVTVCAMLFVVTVCYDTLPMALRYVMLMPYYVMIHHVTLGYAILCYDIPRYVMVCVASSYVIKGVTLRYL